MGGFASYSVSGELLLDTKQFDEKLAASAEKLKTFTKSFESLGSSGAGFGKLGSEMDKLKNSMASVRASGEQFSSTSKGMYSTNWETAKSFSQLTSSANKASKTMKSTSGVMKSLKSIGSMVASVFVWDLASGIIDSTKATVEAKSEMESYYGILNMGRSEISTFNSTLDNTINKFARINKFQLGSMLSSLAVEFKLSQTEMNKAANVVPLVMNEYLRAGRSSEEAVLAVKDVMQGEFMRLSRETGVGKEELKAAGWSGDNKDIESLLGALEKIGSARHWDTFATKANSLSDVMLIMENRFTEFAANLTDSVTPLVVGGFNALAGAFDWLSGAWTNASGFSKVIVELGGLVAMLPVLKEGYSSLKTAVVDFTNARLASIMGLDAETVKTQGLASALAAAKFEEEASIAINEAKVASEYANVAAVEGSTIAETENRIATMLSTEANKLAIGSTRSMALAYEAESLAENSSMTIKQARAAVIQRERLAELSSVKVLASKILGLESEAVAEGGVTGALWAKVLGLEGVEAATMANVFAEATLTEQTYLLTSALLTNPLFLGATAGIMAVVGALYALSKATEADRKGFSAYNKVLDDANTRMDQLSGKYKKQAQNVKSFDDSYHQFLDENNKYTQERIYQSQLQNGLLTEEEKHMHDVYGAASQYVGKLKDAEDTIKELSGQQIITNDRFIKDAKNAGWSDEDAKALGEGLSGWKAWENQSYQDYLETDDFVIQLETLLAMNLAKVGGWLSVNYWDFIFGGGISGAISSALDTYISQPFMSWWNSWSITGLISNWWNTNISEPIRGFLSLFGIDLGTGGQQAGENLKNGLSNGSNGAVQNTSSLMGQVKGTIDSWRSSISGAASSVGTGIKNGIAKVKGAASYVRAEMNDIYNAIKNKAGQIWSSAKNVATGIVSSIKSGLNRASPGDSAKMTEQEMLDMDMFINRAQPSLYSSALGAGRSIVQGMNDANLGSMQNNQALAFGLNSATLANTTNTYTQLNGIVGSSFGSMQGTINSADMMVSNSLINMADTAKSSYTDMASTTTTEMSNVSLTNDQYLNSMTDSTLSSTIEMARAWDSMRGNIVNAASTIRQQSYSKFSSLHRTISSFYRQLASAHFSSGLSAGVPAGPVVGRVGRTWGNTGGRIRTGHGRKLPNVAGSPGAAGGLANLPQTHVNKIMNTAYPWKIADPWFLGIQIPMSNTVRDFANGTNKKVSYSNFEEILTKVLTARGFNNPGSYDFYWNSQKSNQQVWDSVSCNCYDGAELIVEIAQMLGLSGGLVHGSWKGIGHMGAMIGGKLYDMTQFQKHGVFRGTSGVVFGTNSGTSRHSAGRAIDKYSNNSSETVVKHEYNIDVDLSNSHVYGIDDLDNKIDKIFNDKIVKLHGGNPATGY